jgi:hypothetical protein
VTSSDTLRAALLADGRVLIFKGAEANLSTNLMDCCASRIEASDKWIIALLDGGDVRVWREDGAGGIAETSLGYTNAVEVSGGRAHLLVRHADGRVSCVKEGSGGAPEVYSSSSFSSVTTAVRISAGTGSDAALLADNSVRFGDATTTSGQTKTFTGALATTVTDIAAGSNKCYAVLFSSGAAAAYKQASGLTYFSATGALSVAAGGDSHLLAVMSSGQNGTFSSSGTSWSYTAVTNDLRQARSLWWRRNSRLAVNVNGRLASILNASRCVRRLDYIEAAATPGGTSRGIALALTGTCPTNKFTDADSIPDGWEVVHGLDPLDPADASLDSDGDGLANYEEYTCRTDPFDRDSDKDGYEDGWEVASGIFDPTDPADTGDDPDGDGLPNATEYVFGSKPDVVDSDNDGLSDGAETEVPFVTLWEPASRLGRMFRCKAVKVTASDRMRAALLADRGVIVFAGEGAGLRAETNDCGAVDIAATDRWIAALLGSGDVRFWFEDGQGGIAGMTAGMTNAVEISGGYGHVLVRAADGTVSCLKADASGLPVLHVNTLCSAAGTNAAGLSAGTASDAIRLKDGKMRVGDALGSASTLVSPSSDVVDVIAGSNRYVIAVLADGKVVGHSGTANITGGPSGGLFVTGAGSKDIAAVLSDGRNAILTCGSTLWKYDTVVTNRLTDAKDVWWTRDSRLAVSGQGTLLPLAAATNSQQKLIFWSAAVTPRGLSRGIALAVTGTCPTNGNSDGDARGDLWETENGFDPRDGSDLGADDDLDWFSNLDEFECGTGRYDPDSDGDGLLDGWEARYSLRGFNPLAAETNAARVADADPDGDGLDNLHESLNGSDPFSGDTDGDGLTDGAETSIPFLTLWDSAGDTGRVFTACEVVAVTASDTLRAALLKGGRVVVFSGAGAGLTAFTNDCGGAQVDATDEWIVIRTSNGRVLVCRESGGSASFSDVGLSGVDEVSCGYQHFLARLSDGSAVCVRSVSGVPTDHVNALCTAAGTDAVAVAAGREADAVVLADNRVWVGSALAVDTNMLRRFGPVAGGVEMRAGKSYTFVGRKLSDRTCFAWAGNVNSRVYNSVQMPYAAARIEAGSCTNLVALLDNGGTAIMDEYIFTMTYQSNWKYNTLAGAGNARDLWWKREVCLAVTAGGTLLPLNATSASGRKLDFRLAAVTTGANRRGIAAACSGTAPHIADTDGDGALDGWELLLGSSPLDPSGMDADTDSDGMPDWWEKSHGLDPLSAADAPADPDGDGLANLQEFLAGSDPGRRDTDRDGLADRDEVQKYHTDPREVDTDGDGMSDYEECVIYHTDPLVPEPDADRDRIPDGWEVYWGLNPGDPSDASADSDGDGYSNRDEFFTGGKPTSGVPGGRQFCDLLAGGGGSGSGGLRVDVLDDNVCSTPQIVTDNLPFGTLADAGYIVNVTVAGRVEDVNAPFDYVSLLSLFGGGTVAEEEFFHGHEGFPDEDGIPDPPPMVDESASRTVLFLSGGSAALQYDTVDALYHRGCYAEVVNAYVEETLRFTFMADLDRDGAAGPDDDVAAEDSAPGLLLGAEDTGGAKLRIGLLPEGLSYGGFRLSVEPSGDGRVEIRDGTGAAVASAGSPKTWTLSSSQPASAVPSDLSVVPLHASSAFGDIVLKLEYLAAGTVVWSDSIVVTVHKIDMITPAGDPVNSPVDGGDGSGSVPDGANEFTFSPASPGVLTLKLKARVTPSGIANQIKDQVHFTVDGIGASTMAWATATPGGKPTSSGDDLLATVTFTGLPASYSDFASKKAAVCFSGNKQDEESYEVFYPATIANHPGGTSTDPNWFFYYKQNAGGGSYTYTSVGRSSSTSAGGDSSVKIGNEAYAGDQYITTQVSGGQLEATGWSSESKYYANFLGVLAHERHHANNETTAGPPIDSDGDFLAGAYETSTTQTDPNDKYSARGVLIGSSWDDGEVYAGGPIEQTGIQNANTSQDWANPGTNSKP